VQLKHPSAIVLDASEDGRGPRRQDPGRNLSQGGGRANSEAIGVHEPNHGEDQGVGKLPQNYHGGQENLQPAKSRQQSSETQGNKAVAQGEAADA
jgi:hypothetical protein